jgi:hypothetical protein
LCLNLLGATTADLAEANAVLAAAKKIVDAEMRLRFHQQA